MTSPDKSTRGRFFFRFGIVLMTFAGLCLMLAAFAPQPDASALAALATRLPTATAGPSPTPAPAPFCGGFKANVKFLGFNEEGRPRIIVDIRDVRDNDCDGIPNNDDNCDYAANPDQAQSDPNAVYGDACVPESGYRLTNRASEVVIYQMDDGAFHLYSPEGEKLGELTRAGLVQMNPTLLVQQVVGRTYIIGYTNAAGQFRSTRFQSNALTFTAMDINQVVVFPPSVEARPGQAVQFFAKGFHPTGIELAFLPRWSATGGTINQQGWYTAGSAPGDYVVTACRISLLCGTATVKIVP